MGYIKYDGRKFEVGMKLRLAGREGMINRFNQANDNWVVGWKDANDENYFDLGVFPDLEIGIEEPTISQEALDEILTFIETIGKITPALKNKLELMVKKD